MIDHADHTADNDDPGDWMTIIPVMRQDAYDSGDDGVVDRSQGIFAAVTAGIGGINAYQVVFIDPATGTAYPADGTNSTHAGKVAGLAAAAISAGAEGYIQHSGEIENLAWDLDPGEVYFLSSGGELTKTPPVSGFIQRMGIALDSVTLLIGIGEAIIR